MCGIAGIASVAGGAPACLERMQAMCDTMTHRGPDDQGIDVRSGVGLGMRRLSIIDLAGGRQPIRNEDGTVRVVFNGEIYNYRELRRELEAKGHRFATASDTEVIVHLWEEVGDAFPGHLNGMFAIALHDETKRRLVLVRDHLGVKPLYYAFDGRTLVFGSEVKAVLASGIVARELDVDAAAQFLAWEYVPAPATLLRHVRKLRPAEMIDVDLDTGALRATEFWDVSPPHAEARSDTEWEDAVDAQVQASVRRQLVSDVPLGAFLSGGVDSSLVVAAMGAQAQTFSIGFDDPGYDELPWAQAVADSLHVTHRVEIVRPVVADLFDRLMHFMDDPIADFSIFPTYLLSKLARADVKVALTGDGGDELFGGYETYQAQLAAVRWARVPAVVRRGMVEPVVRAVPPTAARRGMVNRARRFVEGLGHDAGLGHARWRIFAGECVQRRLLTPAARALVTTPVGAHITGLQSRAGARDARDVALYVDARSYLPDNCLAKVDRMSMACSLEARVPLLDPALVDLAFRVPASLKYSTRRTKILLKRVARRHVPGRCVDRPKQGFSIPMRHWIGTHFRPMVAELLAPARLAAGGLFEPAVVTRMVDDHLANRANHSHVIWSLLVFEDWQRRWKVSPA
jgi:asparagine synthase (glutamine-hydrolysing)